MIKFRIFGLNCIQFLEKLVNYHGNCQIFQKQEVAFLKSKNFWKTKNFSGQDSSALAIFFDEISKF